MKILRLNFLFILFCFQINAQTPYESEFGKPTEEEFAMTRYEKDTLAPVVILHEQGVYDYKTGDRGLVLVKTVYKKIKVFDASNFDRLVETVPLLTNSTSGESLKDFRGWVHNGHLKELIKDENLLPAQVEGIGTVVNILVSNVKDGSIIEYAYRIESPFLFNLRSWSFQNEIPTLYSELITEIPPGFTFEKALYGKQKFFFQDSKWSPNCLENIYGGFIFRCSIDRFAMKDIPAFKNEKFILSRENYLSRLDFEPTEFLIAGGKKYKLTTDWKTVDKRFRKDDAFGKQLRKFNYFKKHLPDSILRIADATDRAKSIYYFIQNHYTWNGMYHSYGSPLHATFEFKKGSTAEINVALTNALRAAGLDAKLMMISTRENGLPTLHHPVLTKFNYTLVYLLINNETYILDATQKSAPFGLVPFYALNVQVRVMDLKVPSRWAPILPYNNNTYFAKSTITANADGVFTGTVNYNSSGYLGIEKKQEIAEFEDEQSYRNHKSYTEDRRDISDYKFDKGTHPENPFSEEHHISYDPEIKNDLYLIKPFVNHLFFDSNPLPEDENRLYPLDFGYPISVIYQSNIELGDHYTIHKIPDSRTIELPGDNGRCDINYTVQDSTIQINYHFKMNAYRFQPESYNGLREFFQFATDAPMNDVIELRKR